MDISELKTNIKRRLEHHKQGRARRIQAPSLRSTKVTTTEPKEKLGYQRKNWDTKEKIKSISHYAMLKMKPSWDEETVYPLTYPFVTHLSITLLELTNQKVRY